MYWGPKEVFQGGKLWEVRRRRDFEGDREEVGCFYVQQIFMLRCLGIEGMRSLKKSIDV